MVVGSKKRGREGRSCKLKAGEVFCLLCGLRFRFGSGTKSQVPPAWCSSRCVESPTSSFAVSVAGPSPRPRCKVEMWLDWVHATRCPLAASYKLQLPTWNLEAYLLMYLIGQDHPDQSFISETSLHQSRCMQNIDCRSKATWGFSYCSCSVRAPFHLTDRALTKAEVQLCATFQAQHTFTIILTQCCPRHWQGSITCSSSAWSKSRYSSQQISYIHNRAKQPQLHGSST
ncbi:hypothetical protein J3F83DRAFT_411285 [Trichoderma novae-zelandiae]